MKKALHAVLLSLLILPLSLKAQESDHAGLARRLKGHVAVLASDSLEGRGLGTKGKIIAKNYIAGHFRSIGLEALGKDYFHHFDLRIGLARVPAANVVGYLPGSDPERQGEYIVIGAHYDHLGYEYHEGKQVIYPGADDNASGTAVLIELARHFAQNPHLAGRTVIFIAFDAEESGLLGSEKFIDDELFNKDKIRVMFSLDMVGMYEANNGLDLNGIGTLEDGTGLAERIASDHDIHLRKISDNIEARTDTWPFGAAGIPAIHVFTGMNSPYHEPEDTYDLLDFEGMARITLFLQELVSEMSFKKDLNPARRFARLQRPYALRFNYGLISYIGGTHHKYPDEFFRARNVFAFSSGAFLQVHAGSHFTIQPEILLDSNGSRSEEGIYRRYSVTIPVSLQYLLIGDPSGTFRAFPIYGGYFRYNLEGKEGGTDLDFDNLHPSREWGINFGFGLEIAKVNIAYTWRRGLTDISAGSGTRNFDNGRYFTFGYRF
jgi:aminopeptidase YwaD